MVFDAVPAFCSMEGLDGPVVSNNCTLRVASEPKKNLQAVFVTIEGVELAFGGQTHEDDPESFEVLVIKLDKETYNFDGKVVGHCYTSKTSTIKCSMLIRDIPLTVRTW